MTVDDIIKAMTSLGMSSNDIIKRFEEYFVGIKGSVLGGIGSSSIEL